MKIGILSSCEGYEWAGSEENWAWFARAAQSAGHEVMFGGESRLANGQRVQAMVKDGMQVVSRRRWPLIRLYLLKEKWFPDMTGMLKFKPDALLLNAGSPLDFCQLPYLTQFCRRFSVPKVLLLTFNSEILPFTPRPALQDFFSTMAGVICVSEHNRALLERQLARKVPNSCVIRNISRLQLDEPLSYPALDHGVRLACVARLETHWKGHDTLLEVLSTAKWKGRPWRLKLYGTGPDESYIRHLVDFYDLADKVEFCGWAPDIKAMWADCHLLVLPSRGEGMPLTALEAMMCGRPSVLSPAGGNAEIVEHGKTGFIAEASSVSAFDQALERAWSARSSWAEMGRQAHISAQALNATHPGEASLKFFEEVVARASLPHA